ncbi:zinc-binding alcohol dehydrogenase family protein [Pigmentibacter sp. JX0631]|uniref:zinc-binding alcohol dehydrogenase family protein n=1 Tax=Pigmentibacter sp. JX0631 TaxID=2976982 RepID=UPI0024699B06|nr:zinc-binding alcohol dehydrogenase family protein [Pigmentibacter sp. JX0631]WGL59688.1 zinc-binding alcohol dehydrogenase family protein [Pigmentibacter sp. JX0631]
MFAFRPFYNPSTEKIQFSKVELPMPDLKDQDILVKVAAISVNPADYKIALWKKDMPEQNIIGWDVAGVVENVGKNVKNFKVGDKVFYAGALNRQGANAEYHVVDERIVGYMPQSLSFKEAAAVPLTSLTAFEALFEQLKISEDKSTKPKKILLIGAAGGVGSMAIQLLKKLTNCIVIATASRSESIAWVKSLGADFTIDHTKNFLPQLTALGINEVDYSFFINGTEQYFDQISDNMKPFGKIVAIDDPENKFDLMKLKGKSLTFSWELMFTHSLYETEDMIKQHHILNKISQLIDTKTIKTTIANDLGTISEETLEQSHDLLKTGKTIGKIVLTF